MNAEEFDAALGDVHRVFADTSTCIAFLGQSERASVAARQLFTRVADEADPLYAVISVITAAEMLVRPIRQGGSELRTVHEFLHEFPNLRLIQVDLMVALQAANVRSVARLPLPDALIVGTAILSGCEAIVTNDERWSRRLAPLYPQFRWIYLGQ